MQNQTTLTVAEAAQRVGKHKSTINRQIEAGKIVAQMDNRRQYRVDLASLLELYPPVSEQPKTAKKEDNSALRIEADRANEIATERQHRIEDQRKVIVLQQSKIDNQTQTIDAQVQKINRLESITNRAVNHARELAAENQRLLARRWWHFN